ncbi:MAG TPA: metalloregulator ArsR/SmtB family transcription factor [Polyangiaceae bacterium]
MDAVVQALADPIRREILLLLAKKPRNAGEIAAAFSVSRPAISRHLRVLREAGLVSDESIGRERSYTLRLAAIAALEAYLTKLRAACRWERRLAALETEVHRVKRGRRRQARVRHDHNATKTQKETA